MKQVLFVIDRYITDLSETGVCTTSRHANRYAMLLHLIALKLPGHRAEWNKWWGEKKTSKVTSLWIKIRKSKTIKFHEIFYFEFCISIFLFRTCSAFPITFIARNNIDKKIWKKWKETFKQIESKICFFPSLDSSIGSTSAWYLGSPRFKSRQGSLKTKILI